MAQGRRRSASLTSTYLASRNRAGRSGSRGRLLRSWSSSMNSWATESMSFRSGEAESSESGVGGVEGTAGGQKSQSKHNFQLTPDAGQDDAAGRFGKKFLKPSRRRPVVEYLRWGYGLSERRACGSRSEEHTS